MSKKKCVSLGLAAGLALFVLALGMFSLQGTPVVAQVSTETNCTNGLDDDKDGLIDCFDTDCKCEPPKGTPCSPGYWKNHLTVFNATCVQVTGWTCPELLTALTCKGSDATCKRSAAAAALNAISGCTE